MFRNLASKALPSRRALLFHLGLRLTARPGTFVSPMSSRLSMALPPVSVRFNSQSSATEVAKQIAESDVSSSVSEIQNQLLSVNNAPELTSDTLGYLNSIGMAQGWGPTSLMETYFEYVHVYTGLPWWGTIVACTVLLRVVLLPLFVKAAVNNAKMAPIQPKLKQLMNDASTAESIFEKTNLMKERKDLMKEHGVSLGSSFLSFAQLPFAYGIFQGLRKMAAHPVDGFTTQGALWFTDLSQPDPYLGLQALSALLIVAFFRMGGDTGNAQVNPMFKKYIYVFPVIGFLMTMKLSSAVAIYLTFNTILSLLQGLFFRSKMFRNYYKLPDPPKVPQQQQPANFSEWFADFKKRQRELQQKNAENLNKKLEAERKIRLSSRDGFIKRH